VHSPPKRGLQLAGRHRSAAATPSPSWRSNTIEWQAQTYVQGMVRSKSCCEGHLGEDSFAAVNSQVRRGVCGSNATSSYSGLGGTVSHLSCQTSFQGPTNMGLSTRGNKPTLCLSWCTGGVSPLIAASPPQVRCVSGGTAE